MNWKKLKKAVIATFWYLLPYCLGGCIGLIIGIVMMVYLGIGFAFGITTFGVFGYFVMREYTRSE